MSRKQNFEKSSYLTQVRSLRTLAENAIHTHYAFKLKTLHFINHGENTTFRAIDTQGKSYLIRVHRKGYHTDQAIKEEHKWLKHLDKTNKFLIPKIVTNKSDQSLTHYGDKLFPGKRQISAFKWQDGKIVTRRLNEDHLFLYGKSIAELQNETHKVKPKHRMYGSPDGLIGKTPTFGPMTNVWCATRTQQRKLDEAVKINLKWLRSYEKKAAKKGQTGMCHLDPHLGNVLFHGTKKMGFIDFDDCGYGMHSYELATALMSFCAWHSNIKKKNKKGLAPIIDWVNAFRDGHASVYKFGEIKIKDIEQMIVIRTLAMTGWLNSRSDNPRLKKMMPKRLEENLYIVKHPQFFFELP